MQTELSRYGRFFKRSMGVLGVIFLIGALLFMFIPEDIVRLVNWMSDVFQMDNAPIVKKIPVAVYWTIFNEHHDMPAGLSQMPAHRMYIGLAVSYMVLITVICFACYLKPRKYIHWVPLLILSKGVSAFLGLWNYGFSYEYLANLIAFITDLPIFVFVLVIYLMARKEFANRGAEGV